MQGCPKADRRRRSGLECEPAGYSAADERCDLKTILDRYPDDTTDELRRILAEPSYDRL